MIDLTVSLQPGDVAKFRRLLQANRTLAAKALTFTAEKAQASWRGGQRVFHKRSSWIDRGVRLRAATAGNLTAGVGTIDKFMGRHIKGVAEPKVGRLLIPIYDNIDDVPTHRRMRAKLKAMHATKRKPFLLRADGETYLARRLGKARSGLSFLAKVQQGARIRPRLDALRIVERSVEREFPTVYGRLLAKWMQGQGQG